MDHLVGGVGELGWVALKALLLYLTAVLGFRVGQRRTLADLSPFDFVAAVAVGSIVGRVPNASDASYLAGLATLAALLLAHWGLTRLRRFPSVAHLLEQTPRLLVAQGRTNQEIGTALRMSTATVKAYVSRILTKLDCANRVQVAIIVHEARD